MPLSEHYRALRAKVGTDLLLIPAVAAVIHDADGRVLIQRRRNGLHSLPAGAIEPGESPRSAIIREVREETGLLVVVDALLGVFGGTDYRHILPNGHVVEYTVCLFRCLPVSGTLGGLDGESASLHYYSPEEIPPLATEYPRALFQRQPTIEAKR